MGHQCSALVIFTQRDAKRCALGDGARDVGEGFIATALGVAKLARQAAGPLIAKLIKRTVTIILACIGAHLPITHTLRALIIGAADLTQSSPLTLTNIVDATHNVSAQPERLGTKAQWIGGILTSLVDLHGDASATVAEFAVQAPGVK